MLQPETYYDLSTDVPKKGQYKVRISTRQHAVLSYLAAGFKMTEIAKRLKISPGTAAMYRRKLGMAFRVYDGNAVLLLAGCRAGWRAARRCAGSFCC